jgi:hypothetical protein
MTTALADTIGILADIARGEFETASQCWVHRYDDWGNEHETRSIAVQDALAALRSDTGAQADPARFLAARVGRCQLDGDAHVRAGRLDEAKQARMAGAVLHTALVAVLRAGEMKGNSQVAVDRHVSHMLRTAREKAARS